MFKKIFSFSIVAIEIFALACSPFYARAWSPADFIDPISKGITKAFIGDASSLVNSLLQQGERRYHLNQGSMQEYGENMNVSKTKSSAPEVMVNFSPSDPKVGEKLTATALPMYFSTPTESLYFTWYLKHKGCDLNKNPSRRVRDLCDRDDDDKITVEDWKIEAMRAIANNGFMTEKADYNTSINDNDGYKAHMGGDSNIRPTTNYHCYIHDFKNGENYEITDATADITNAFYLSDGTVCAEENVRCVKGDTLLCPPAFSTGYSESIEYQICKDSFEQPFCDPDSCVGDNCDAICPEGTSAYCASSSSLDPECSEISADAPCSSAGNAISYCTTGLAYSEFTDVKVCKHLFPNAPGYETGNNLFPRGEEKFWRTNPEDPDTADNGNKDEANVAGLGLTEFTWNYDSGDKVGVVVEGESMIPTKHDDSSMMIMWALPKNKCEVENKGSYVKKIKGYNVTIPTAGVDINGCLRDNLIDPREGGQPKNLEVSLSYSPENPVNDPTEDDMGDRVTVQSVLSNANRPTSQLYYKWRVKISRNGEFSLDNNNWIDITTDDSFFSAGENISLTEGINISSLNFDLNFDRDEIESYLKNGIGYLRVYLNVEENFEQGETRSGNSDVIIRFVSSDKKIIPHKTIIGDDGKLILSNPICQGDLMEKSVCFVVKNEIIGVDVSDSNLRNFSWTFNGKPLVCDSSISDSCRDDRQTGTNFFPVIGNPGDTYTLTVTANDTSPDVNDPNLGNTVHLVKNFQIVKPSVKIVSSGENFNPKILGSYQNLEGESFTDYSEKVFQSPENSTIHLTTSFFPNFIGMEENFNGDNPRTKVQWVVGGIEESREKDFEIAIDKPSGSVYNINLNAIYEQPPAVRKALGDIWNVSQFESVENKMSNFIQIEVTESSAPADQSAIKGTGKALASLLSYFPAQLMFLLRILLTMLMVIFVSGAILSISPQEKK